MPAELYDKYWWTYADAGRVGTTAQIGLPAGERVLTAVEGVVVSTRGSGSDSLLLVRDFATGKLLRQIPAGLDWPEAVVVEGRLFWTGVTGDGNDIADGGVWSSDARTRESPTQIVAPGRALGGALCGRHVDVSPTGRTIAATAPCIGLRGWTDVIDVASGVRVKRLADTFAKAFTDDTFLAWDHEPTDGFTFGMGGVTAYELNSGVVRWRYPDASNVDRFLFEQARAFGTSFFVESRWDTAAGLELRLTVFSAASGQHRLLLRQSYSDDVMSIYAAASNDRYIALKPWSESISVRGTAISLVRIEDGTLMRDAFVIDPPWICGDEYCLRD